MRLVALIVVVLALQGCLDHQRTSLEVRFADAPVEAAHAAVRRAAVEFGSNVYLDDHAAHILTASWRATLTETERQQYASDINTWQTVNVVTLPLQLGAAMYGGGGGATPGSDVPETFTCTLCAAISPIDYATSEVRILMKRPGSQAQRRADFEDFWKLVERDVRLRSPTDTGLTSR